MLLDGVTLIATPRYTWKVRGSSSEHPNAIDFGWNGAGTQNQPLYCGVYGAIECKVARKRFIDGGSGSGATGHVIDIRFETPNYTCYRSSMHMATESPLAIGTPLNWDSVIGTMGSTGDSTGPHDHVILAICPKGTPVEEMYNYRVRPDDYYYYANNWHTADNLLPWITLGESPSTTPGDNGQSLDIGHMVEVDGVIKMSEKYEVIKVDGDIITLKRITNIASNLGKWLNINGKTTLYNSAGKEYPAPAGQQRSMIINEEKGDFYRVSSTAFNPNVVYIKKNATSITVTSSPQHSKR